MCHEKKKNKNISAKTGGNPKRGEKSVEKKIFFSPQNVLIDADFHFG